MIQGLPPIRPAERWYRALLEAGQRAEIATTAKRSPLAEKEYQWLPVELRNRVRAVLSGSRRLPQELVGR